MKKKNFEQIKINLLVPVGNRIRKYRKMRKISRLSMAEYVGVKPLQIIQYETGNCDICLSRLLKISECLRIPCSELLPEQNNIGCLSDNVLSLLSYIEEKSLNVSDILTKIKKGVL